MSSSVSSHSDRAGPGILVESVVESVVSIAVGQAVPNQPRDLLLDHPAFVSFASQVDKRKQATSLRRVVLPVGEARLK